MHPLSTVLATTVYNEIESSAREHATAPRRTSRLRKRIARRRAPASGAHLGPHPAVRAGRA
jgi:hypothetical protein